MSKRNWWERDNDLDSDDADDAEGGWLDDFAFDDADDDADFVGSIWGKYGGSTGAGLGERIVAAQKLVQGFVNTFATGDSRGYRVAFDKDIRTAGTDFDSKVILISHAPLEDPTISTDEANTVLTAMAAHESSHVRYGRKTAAGVRREFPGDATAAKVSNILDDVRIERRFAADYPGYANVFVPALAYVAKSSAPDAKDVGDGLDTSTMGPLNLMVAGVRYADHVRWTAETVVEREWWSDWSDRWTATDSVRDHVSGVREGLDHLAERVEEQKRRKATNPGPTCGPTGPGGNGGEPTDEPPTGQTTGTVEPSETPAETEPEEIELPICFAEEIERIAAENGATNVIDDATAQEMVEQGKALAQAPSGNTGEVYWSPRGVARGRKAVAPSGSAAASIRAAFARQRTGHYAVQKGLRSGRLDNRSITRIASTDDRLFAKRTAPSEGRYLVWLMVDCSGSMSGHPMDDAIAVSSALAAASRLLPNVRLNIWGWTNGAKLGMAWGATRVWSTGDPISNVGYLGGIRMGGTPDRDVLDWTVSAIRKQTAPGEKPMILMASDGAGNLYGSDLVDAARRSGVEVVSVALGYLSEKHQSDVYGPKGYIPWGGSISATAKPLGDLIGRATATK